VVCRGGKAFWREQGDGVEAGGKKEGGIKPTRLLENRRSRKTMSE